MTRLAVVIPTRNRPDELVGLLDNLAEQTRRPNLVVVVDGSDPEMACEQVVRRFGGGLDLRYVRHHPPSAAAQRNVGIALASKQVDLIALLDDDVRLPPDTLAQACVEIASLPDAYVGFGMNIAGEQAPDRLAWLKRSALSRRAGLYPECTGRIAPSGWHSRLSAVSQLTEVDWLLSGAVIWRAEVFDGARFDEFFEQYSYLEDLEFSLQARKRGRFALLPNVRFTHQPAAGGRKSQFWFGRREVRNRHYIVIKHNLSLTRFWCGMSIRSVMTAGAFMRGQWGQGERLLGNLVEIPLTLVTGLRRGR